MRTVSRFTCLASAVFVGFCASGMASAAPPEYVITRITDLDMGKSGTIGVVNDINECGQVVGQVWLSSGNLHQKPFVWGNGNLLILDVWDADANAINDLSQVVGAGASAGAFLWEDNTIHILGSGTAYGLNNLTQVVGDSSGRACMWDDGVFTNLGTLGGGRSSADDINESGLVVGWSNRTGEDHYRKRHPVIWRGGIITDLGFDVPSVSGSGEATAVNGAGQVVGYFQVGGWNHTPNAFLWDNGAVSCLNLTTALESTAYDINNLGQVVGSYKTSREPLGCAFLYDEGVTYDLFDLVSDPAGWDRLGVATTINDRGQIAGVGSYEGNPHLFLVTPVPEPGTMFLLGAGAVLCKLVRPSERRRRTK